MILAAPFEIGKSPTTHLLPVHPEGYDRYSPMVSRLLHRMIVDILATCVALRIVGNRLQPMLREMKNNLRNKRSAFAGTSPASRCTHHGDKKGYPAKRVENDGPGHDVTITVGPIKKEGRRQD